MTDPKLELRAAQAGALLKGTAGNVLTAQADGTWRGEPPSGAQGPQGPQGDTGPQGPQGPQGAPGAGSARLVASGTSLVGAFAQLTVGPFTIEPTEVPDIYVYVEGTFGGEVSTWGSGGYDYVWSIRNNADAANDFSVYFQNTTGTGQNFRWAVYAYPM